MKSLFRNFILVLGIMVAMVVRVDAQRAIKVIDNKLISDSTVYNFTPGDRYHVEKWSAFRIEVLWSNRDANDSLSTVEVYNTINNNFTGASQITTEATLDAADGAGSTGTSYVAAETVTDSYLQYLRIVVDPDAGLDGTPRVTVRIVPLYKTNYNPPAN